MKGILSVNENVRKKCGVQCQCNLTEGPTVFPSGDVHILAESGVGDGFEDLESSQDFDGVRG